MKKLVYFFILLLMVACSKEPKKVTDQKFIFGTMINITIYDSSEKKARNAMKLVYDELSRIDKKFNSRSKESLIYKLNDGSITEAKLDDEGLFLIKNISSSYELSKGKYDISIKPMMDLWGFENGEGVKTLPSKEDIEKIKEKVDFSKIKLSENQLSYSDIKLDTGSFLKGYAISKGAEILKANGIKHGMISAISSIATVGKKPDGNPWKIAIQDPSNMKKRLGIASLENKAVGVSGDYQTFVEIDGKKYHHLLDKTTGHPIKDKRMIVVLADDAFMADMLSTAFFMMDNKDIIDYVDSKGELEVMIVKDDMKQIKSKNYDNYMK